MNIDSYKYKQEITECPCGSLRAPQEKTGISGMADTNWLCLMCPDCDRDLSEIVYYDRGSMEITSIDSK